MTIINNMPSNGNIHHATYRSISLQRSLTFLLLDNVYLWQFNLKQGTVSLFVLKAQIFPIYLRFLPEVFTLLVCPNSGNRLGYLIQ
ncbi:hypothetical protein H6G96_02370 [Nostoc sp. FACHB-892]|jgi:hypothetical protein|uniref:hypothetical protein n=1 Tax=Nostoc sp. FACHB-892 TaxID=2692843 RepID=UPI001685BBDD|nr:hypothetical protein [Nostoc sp. FACHB-892]MBD2725199.1 hypothetical protein [Nostoc sp. FACHB-892]